nr:MAG TPA: hypothetical protein [Caudoviricetes sp.]
MFKLRHFSLAEIRFSLWLEDGFQSAEAVQISEWWGGLSLNLLRFHKYEKYTHRRPSLYSRARGV